MANDRQADPETIDYTALMRSAVLDMVRNVLARVATEGLPGEHHFYMTFGTRDEGVSVSRRLRQQFPEEMTIVLQHQFWGLEVDAERFAVTLRFGGSPERLSVPWAALRTFVDPSVGFGLRLRADDEKAEPAEGPSVPAEPDAPAAASRRDDATDPPGRAEADKIVDFHAFRRKGEESDPSASGRD